MKSTSFSDKFLWVSLACYFIPSFQYKFGTRLGWFSSTVYRYIRQDRPQDIVCLFWLPRILSGKPYFVNSLFSSRTSCLLCTWPRSKRVLTPIWPTFPHNWGHFYHLWGGVVKSDYFFIFLGCEFVTFCSFTLDTWWINDDSPCFIHYFNQDLRKRPPDWCRRPWFWKMVAVHGFEPRTFGLWFHCSNQLSYSAIFLLPFKRQTISPRSWLSSQVRRLVVTSSLD